MREPERRSTPLQDGFDDLRGSACEFVCDGFDDRGLAKFSIRTWRGDGIAETGDCVDWLYIIRAMLSV